MQETSNSDDLIFRLHLIWMSDTHDDPTVRILLVATGDIPAVYEGLGSWSSYSVWIRNLCAAEATSEPQTGEKTKRVAQRVIRNRFSTLRQRKISVRELAMRGFHRVDC